MICRKCGEDKQEEAFALSSYTRKSDGVRSRSQPCRSCRGDDERKRYLRDYHRLKKYGMSEEDYLEMVEEQGGQCAICGQDPTPRGLFIDHCHTTGKVRGLLCTTCNTMLGHAGESIEILQAGIEYLNKNTPS